MPEKVDPANALANKVNQSLGDELVKAKLIDLDAKEKATPMFREHLVKGEIKRASLLKILTWDLKILSEQRVLDHLIEESNLGYCNLNNYIVTRETLPYFRVNECWATMSVPVDFLEGVFFVTTCHYLSEAAREHWNRRLNRDIVWMISDISSMTMTLEKMEKQEKKELADAEERKKLRKTRSPFTGGGNRPAVLDEEGGDGEAEDEGWVPGDTASVSPFPRNDS